LKKNFITENEIANLVFEAGQKVHKVLRPELLEIAFQEPLFYEFKIMRLNVIFEKTFVSFLKTFVFFVFKFNTLPWRSSLIGAQNRHRKLHKIQH
jgi:hypothetical protein